MNLLESSRLILRPWKENDLYDLYEYASDELVGPRAGWPVHKSIGDSKKILESFINGKEVYAIELKCENKVIGSIGLHYRKPDKNLEEESQREIGYALNPKYWGQGIMPEAVKLLIDYGFRDLNLNLIWCAHYEENLNSKRVCKKSGFNYKFTKEKVLELLDNRKVKVLYYNLSKDEYLNR